MVKLTNTEKLKHLMFFKNKFYNIAFLCLNGLLFSLTIVLTQIELLRGRTNSILLDVTQIATNSSTFIIQTIEWPSIIEKFPVTLFWGVSTIIFLLNIIFSRFFPRKAGLTSIYLAVRTVVYLLIRGTAVKSGSISLWSALSTIEAPYSIEIVFSRTYLSLLVIVVTLLLVQGVFFLVVPAKAFRKNEMSSFPFTKESANLLKYLLILMPLTLFITGDGTMVISSYLYAIDEQVESQLVLTAAYVFSVAAIIILLFIFFNIIKEPFTFPKQEEIRAPRKRVLLLFLSGVIGIILWFFYFFYGSLFFLGGMVSWEILRTLLQVEIEPFAVAFVLIVVFYYVRKRKRNRAQQLSSYEREELSSTKEEFVHRPSVQIVTSILLLLSLCTSCFVLPLYVDLSDYYSFSSKIGLDMDIKRACTITEAQFLANGTFEFMISININFTHVPHEAQGSFIVIRELVVDTDNNSFYDSYYYLHNLSISNPSDTLTTNIGSHQNGSSLIIVGYGFVAVRGSVNQTFTVGECLTFVFAHQITEEYFSVVFEPCSVIIESS